MSNIKRLINSARRIHPLNCIGLALAALLSTNALSQSPVRSGKRAESLLTDAQGKERAILEMRDDQPYFAFLDSEGREVVLITPGRFEFRSPATDITVSVTLDETGSRIAQRAGRDGALLSMEMHPTPEGALASVLSHSSPDRFGFHLMASQRISSLVLEDKKMAAPNIRISNTDDISSIEVGRDDISKATLFTHKSGETRLQILDNNGKPALSLPSRIRIDD